ncbi:MAG: glycosyltransferase [Proteobacteria bacterium]|nr:glycosyltransferase [Pseudomonadota bacterium]NIS69380.1 glycosyltransferase [Pseudomonadota bacterium]
MRITILTVGSRGDVEPYVALGVGLQASGHEVQLATHTRFEAFAQSRGLGFSPVQGDPLAILGDEPGRMWLESGQNPYAFVRRMLDAMKPVAWEILNDFWAACQNTDIILYSVLAAFAATSIAEKLAIPSCPAYLQHVHPTRSYPSPMAMPLSPLGGIYNRLTYPLGEQIVWHLVRRLTNHWRQETLGLPRLPFRSTFGKMLKRHPLCLYGFSPNVLPKPPEWGAEVSVTGYWFLEKPADWQPPAALVDFLQSGPPPVSIGFGSMTSRKPEEISEIALQALAGSRQRGLLLTGWGGLSHADLPDDVFKIDSVPYDWLFPQMSAVVHHGGTGTTGAGLRAGVPSVIVPFFADQPFWAWRVRELRVGPRPIPQKKLSAEQLTAAIHETTSNREMKMRAAALGQRIQAEDGVAQAVAALNHHLAIH